ADVVEIVFELLAGDGRAIALSLRPLLRPIRRKVWNRLVLDQLTPYNFEPPSRLVYPLPVSQTEGLLKAAILDIVSSVRMRRHLLSLVEVESWLAVSENMSSRSVEVYFYPHC